MFIYIKIIKRRGVSNKGEAGAYVFVPLACVRVL